MAKPQAAARFVTEVAPAKVVSIMRRTKVSRRSLLDPIAEDEREHQPAYYHGQDHHQQQQTPPEERAGGLVMRELSKYFSDAHGHEDRMSWEQSSGHHHRRAVCT